MRCSTIVSSSLGGGERRMMVRPSQSGGAAKRLHSCFPFLVSIFLVWCQVLCLFPSYTSVTGSPASGSLQAVPEEGQVASGALVEVGTALHQTSMSMDNPDSVLQPSSDAAWVCRVSVFGGVCAGNSGDSLLGQWRFCPKGQCCSMSKCGVGGCSVGICEWWSSVLCLIKNNDYADDKCNCQRYGERCSPNAVCKDVLSERGGSFCVCKKGYIGDGKTCEFDPCSVDPCNPGSCRRNGKTYTCSCPETYVVAQTEAGERCEIKKNYCLGEPCGPKEATADCVGFDDGTYECICQDSYVFNGKICERFEACAENPCGDPEGVIRCTADGEEYSCECREGYDLVEDPPGKQKCEKNSCYGNPCGPSHLVQSCAPRQPDQTSPATYTCLCTTTGVLHVDPDTGAQSCTPTDPCATEPCGSAAVVDSCINEGSTYRCNCKPGHVSLEKQGKKQCVEGDPCELNACGAEELVDSCSTDSSKYVCECSATAIKGLNDDGQQVCVSRQDCEAACGPLEGVKQCDRRFGGGLKCQCKQGYVASGTGNKKQCVKGDVCLNKPCGSSSATQQCTAEKDGSYSCVCKEGYDLRFREDGTQTCAEAGECTGSPCGANSSIGVCTPGPSAYTCTCVQPYERSTNEDGRETCKVPELLAPEPTVPSNTKTEEESSSTSLAVMGIGGLLLLGVGTAYFLKSNGDDQQNAMEPYGVDPMAPPGGFGPPGPGGPSQLYANAPRNSMWQ
ncbi:microneme-like protein [Besnoitia besnoiti]|uniref:Microneme-like protein n=1 Tax=Besnoitia besnoiti TaxID=94643 RepID=A0A2A9MGC6_BESBE|nr:microneme-like protein [Besnoitia besnoiti]PFH34703.1 microneme-like protein [Besnoitia besnoiti]